MVQNIYGPGVTCKRIECNNKHAAEGKGVGVGVGGRVLHPGSPPTHALPHPRTRTRTVVRAAATL